MRATTNKHRDRSRWYRRHPKVAALVGSLAAFTLAAAAVFFGLAHIRGGVVSTAFGVEFRGTPVVTLDSMVGTAVVEQPDLVLDVTSAFPGSSMTVGTLVAADGNQQNGVVTGLVMPGLPSGWTAELTSGCAAAVMGNPTVTTPITLVLTMTEDAAAGSAGTFLEGAGIQVTPQGLAGQVTPDCTYSGS